VFLFALVLGAAAALFVGLTTAWRLSRAASLRPVLAAGIEMAKAIGVVEELLKAKE